MRRVLASLLVFSLLTSACTSERDEPEEQASKPVREADVRCESTERGRFYAENATYEDVDALDLPLANPSEADIDATPLERATKDMGRSRRILSFLVMADGKLVWERYFNGSQAHHAENIHSAAKSLLSLVAGRAIEEGKLSLNDRVGEHLPVPKAARDLKVKHLLTMSAGLEWEENATEETFDDETSYVTQILSRERVDEPGERFAYNTGLTHVLSAVIAETTGSSTCAFAHEELFSPIGVSVDHWLEDRDGYNAGGHSTFVTPRELARIGQFVLDDGEGKLDEGWLERSLDETWDIGCRAPGERRSYGYLWWRSDIGGVEVFSAEGYGGQALMLVPSLDVAVVVTHDTFGEPSGEELIPPIELLTNFVLPAAGAKVDTRGDCHAFDVHRVDIDGKDERRLTAHPSLDIWASPSPDGKRIVFASRRDLNWELYVMDADGDNERRLTTDPATDSFPTWSPDGERILFAKDGRRAGLYTVKPDGSDARRLTNGRDNTPAWSPDGSRIAFNRATGTEGALWVLDVEDRRQQRLTGGAGGIAPAFSPDGRQIAFYTREGKKETVRTVIATGAQPETVGPGRDPRWLPDGSLVFSTRGGVDDTARIARRNAGKTRTIIDLPGDELLPIPSPDGRWLTFVSAAADAPAGTGAEE